MPYGKNRYKLIFRVNQAITFILNKKIEKAPKRRNYEIISTLTYSLRLYLVDKLVSKLEESLKIYSARHRICYCIQKQMIIFKKIRIITFTALLLLFPNLNAQTSDLKFSHITTEEGLSFNNITNIIQDSRGFLWISTFNGLNRYDGYNFKIFLPDISDPKSISGQTITCMVEDEEGFIWVGTTDGLNKYDWKTEQFTRYKNNPRIPGSLSNDLIYSIFQDDRGTVWVGTLNGLNKYNRNKDNFTVFTKVSDRFNSDSTNSVIYIEEGSEGNLWLSTWNGLTCMDKEGKIIRTYFSQSPDAKKFEYRKISVVFKDRQKNLWIGINGKGLKKLNLQTGEFTDFYTDLHNPNTISDGFVTTIFQDRNNKLWIGTRNGLNIFDPKKNIFTRIFNDPQKSYSVINNKITSIMEDKSGIIWIGTYTGLSRLYYPINNFHYYKEPFIKNNTVISAFLDNNNNIWVCTMGGLDEIKNNKKYSIHFSHDPKNKNSLSDDFVRSVFVDKSGIVWIGTNNEGLNRFDPQTGKFQLFTYDVNDSTSISNKGIVSVCEDNSGSLWFGTWWGLNRFDKKTQKFTRYLSNPDNPNGLRNNSIWDLYLDSHGMIWAGTGGGGVSEIDPKTGTFINNFTNDSTNKYYISNNRVFTILESSDGLMWFGTIYGLNCYNRNTGKTIVYTKEDGLPSNLIDGIQEDKRGYLWIATGNGLSKFDRKNKKFINYNKRNGIENLEFIQNIALKSKDGQLYFGSDGLLFFYPDRIKDEYLTSPVVFTDLKIYNQSVPISRNGILKESITGEKKITLPPGNDVVTLDFALLDYSDVKRNSFRYKLDGFDRGWNNVGTRNSATYTNLPPGKYKFIVQATNNNGVRNQKEASIQMIITPKYFQTLWFKFALGLVIILSAFIIIHGRTKKIKNRNKLLQQMVTERTKDLDKTIQELSREITERKKAEKNVQASLKEKEVLLSEKESLLSEKEVLLKEIHHRVKNNLQVISSLLYLNSKNVTDKKALDMFTDSQNRVKSIALVHERLYRSKDLGRIDFREYVKHLTTDLFRTYAVNPSVISLDININDIFINIDFAVPCGLIINELISNSLKYAFPNYHLENKKGIINVDFNKYDSDKLMLSVSDNGIGLPNEVNKMKNLSLGLQLVDSLVAQLEGTLKVERNYGTSFKIIFNNGIS